MTGGKPDAGCETGTAEVCCRAGACVTGEEISGEAETDGDVVAGSPIVAPDIAAVLFPRVPGIALIAYSENEGLVAVQVTCPCLEVPTVVGRAVHPVPA